MARIAINGFGRIGRCIVRAALERKDSDLEFVSINDLTDTKTLAHLLKYDSVHGVLDAEVKATPAGILVNGKEIQVTAVKSPADLKHGSNGIDLVLECTGLFTEREKAEQHLGTGARWVLISAPAKNPDITIAYGINHDRFDKANHLILSNASCTTCHMSKTSQFIQRLRLFILDSRPSHIFHLIATSHLVFALSFIRLNSAFESY